MREVVVVGGGTAGLIAALTLMNTCDNVQVTIVRSSAIGHIMVGEGTVGSTPSFFHKTLGISPEDFHSYVKPTFKLGVRFLWGSRPYFDYTFNSQLEQPCFPNSKIPLGYYFLHSDWQGISSVSESMSQNLLPFSEQSMLKNGTPKNAAYHFENHAFVEFLEKRFEQLGGSLIDATVLTAELNDQGIASLLLNTQERLSADFFIDASGFRGELIHKQLGEPYISMNDHLFCDKAIVGGWERQENEPIKPYTTAETMDAGWCWQIEHEHIINRGYVHSSQFISEDEAVNEFKGKNPKITDVRVVPFETRRIRRSWVKNVVAIGNACGFVEPLEATNIQVICNQSYNFANAFNVSTDSEIFRQNHNDMVEKEWKNIRDFLALHYRFNDRLKTPFWQFSVNETPLGDIEDYVNFYQEAGPSSLGFQQLPKVDLFSQEGYLVMLLGMRVPWKGANEYASLSAEQANVLKFFKQGNALQAMQGVSTEKLFSRMKEFKWS